MTEEETIIYSAIIPEYPVSDDIKRRVEQLGGTTIDERGPVNFYPYHEGHGWRRATSYAARIPSHRLEEMRGIIKKHDGEEFLPRLKERR